jgi:hypothetical protein
MATGSPGSSDAGIAPVAVSRPTKSLSMENVSSAQCSHFAQAVSAWLGDEGAMFERDRLGHRDA